VVCATIDCSNDCTDHCGWSSFWDSCVPGALTNPETEANLGTGCGLVTELAVEEQPDIIELPTTCHGVSDHSLCVTLLAADPEGFCINE